MIIKGLYAFFFDDLQRKSESLNKYEVTSSEANNIEITKRDVSKGNALEKLK